jgi:hypothetical protein
VEFNIVAVFINPDLYSATIKDVRGDCESSDIFDICSGGATAKHGDVRMDYFRPSHPYVSNHNAQSDHHDTSAYLMSDAWADAHIGKRFDALGVEFDYALSIGMTITCPMVYISTAPPYYVTTAMCNNALASYTRPRGRTGIIQTAGLIIPTAVAPHLLATLIAIGAAVGTVPT